MNQLDGHKFFLRRADNAHHNGVPALRVRTLASVGDKRVGGASETMRPRLAPFVTQMSPVYYWRPRIYDLSLIARAVGNSREKHAT